MAAIASEDELLGLIAARFPAHSDHVALGRGDDCAELVCPERLALSSDLFLDGVHFRRSYFAPEEIGHKALAVNLSDLAAAGARPLAFSLGLMLPDDLERQTICAILDGMAALAVRHGCVLCGGDITRSSTLGFSVTIWGASSREDDAFLRRKGTGPGDVLICCGHPGLARAGLLALEERGREAVKAWPEICRALLRPEPILDAGKVLAAINNPHRGGPACKVMDLSDGLARDLPRLLEGMGAELTLAPQDLHPALTAFARERNIDPLEVAVQGGDDYGLLVAVPAELEAQAVSGLRSICAVQFLGRVTANRGIRLNGHALAGRGFDHFQTRT